MISHHQVQYQNSITYPVLRKLSDRRTDGETDRQTDRQTERDFIGGCPTKVGRPKK